MTTNLQIINEKTTALADSIEINEILSQDDLLKTNEQLSAIKIYMRRIDEIRKEQTDPLEKKKKAIIAQFAPAYNQLKELSEKIGHNIKLYDKRMYEERKLMLEEAKKKNEVAIVEKPQKTIRTEHGTTSIKKIWDFNIVDASIIPREFYSVDEDKIIKAIKGGEREISGVEIYQRTSLSTRTK